MTGTPSPSSRRRTPCRNCGAPAPGAYCPACGQETRARLPTFAQFMREAAGRYVALDGRLWRTLGPLVFRPGFLTREYFAGRRRRYIRPARLFLVSSVLLFAALRIVVELGGGDVELVRFGRRPRRTRRRERARRPRRTRRPPRTAIMKAACGSTTISTSISA